MIKQNSQVKTRKFRSGLPLNVRVQRRRFSRSRVTNLTDNRLELDCEKIFAFSYLIFFTLSVTSVIGWSAILKSIPLLPPSIIS